MNYLAKAIAGALVSAGLASATAPAAYAQDSIEAVIAACTDAASCGAAVRTFMGGVPLDQRTATLARLLAALRAAATANPALATAFNGGIDAGGEFSTANLDDSPLDIDTGASTN